MRRRTRTSIEHYATCLALLLANASCMPGATRMGASASIRSAAGASVAAASPQARSAVAAPLPVLLTPAPGDVAAAFSSPLVAPPFAAADAGAETIARATECLTQAVYYEARSEPLDGQRAVAQVVLNRVRNPAFPASVCGVVHQRSATGGGCQFTFDCDGSTTLPLDRRAWDRARDVAVAALGGAVYAPAGAATYYHTTAVSPWWSSRLTRIAQIGAHIFYRLGDMWSSRLDFHQAYAAAEPRSAVTESADALTANVLRFAIADGGSIAIHHGATAIAGVTVHRGGGDAPVQDTGEDDGSVHVHVGSAPGEASVADAVVTVKPGDPAGPA